MTPPSAAGTVGATRPPAPTRRLGPLLVQGAILAALVALAAWFASGVAADLRHRGLTPGLAFLGQQAGFRIGEGPTLGPHDTYGRALAVGLANTLRVAVPGMFLATVVGLALALARLSGNPLAAGLARAITDTFRNTPLLVQLVFLYRGIILSLPEIASAHSLGSGPAGAPLALLSRRGLALPALEAAPAAGTWLACLAVAAGLGAAVARRTLRRERQTGQPARPTLWILGLVALGAATAYAATGSGPVSAQVPERGRFGYTGATVLTPEYLALLTGLVLYTGAFSAEVFRAGIQAVAAGQTEAARSLGLSYSQVLRFVVLPQAVRIVVPPLTSQYLNLAKNSSLAIAVGYPDLFNVGQTIGNQSGQALTVIALMMAVYLGISLSASFLMHLFHRRLAWGAA